MTSLYVLSVFLYSSFVLFLGIITRGKMLFFFLFFWGGVSGLCCIGLLFLSVTLDKEQADWTLLASAVPSCLKDDLYLYFEVFPFFSLFVFIITKYKQ